MKGKKTGGRTKGVPNKVTQEHRELINKLISCPKDLESDLKVLEPKERIDAIIKLLEFTTPKQSRVEATVDNKVSISSIKFEDA
jgi:hypothetical protein